MSSESVSRWSALSAALGGLLGGIATAGDERLSAALFATGFVLLGVWLVLVIRHADKDTPDTLTAFEPDREHEDEA